MVNLSCSAMLRFKEAIRLQELRTAERISPGTPKCARRVLGERGSANILRIR